MAERVEEEQEARRRAEWLAAVQTGHNPGDTAEIAHLAKTLHNATQILSLFETALRVLAVTSGHVRTSQVLDYVSDAFCAVTEGDETLDAEGRQSALQVVREIFHPRVDDARVNERNAEDAREPQPALLSQIALADYMTTAIRVVLDARRQEDAEKCAEEGDGPSLEDPPQE